MARCLVVAILVTIALALAAPAVAAMCVRWEPPSRTPDGNVRVAFRTFAPLAGGGRRPWAVPNYPFRVFLAAPDEETRLLAMTPTERDPALWVGSFAPKGDGPWNVSIANFEEAQQNDKGCYRPLRVDLGEAEALAPRVEGVQPSTSWWPWVAGAVALLLGVTATARLVARRYRLNTAP